MYRRSVNAGSPCPSLSASACASTPGRDAAWMKGPCCTSTGPAYSTRGRHVATAGRVLGLDADGVLNPCKRLAATAGVMVGLRAALERRHVQTINAIGATGRPTTFIVPGPVHPLASIREGAQAS